MSKGQNSRKDRFLSTFPQIALEDTACEVSCKSPIKMFESI
jgi:hypothetical protein